MEIVFALIVGWALGVATAVMWPQGKPLPPLGGPPRIPTNLPQGTGAVRSVTVVLPSGLSDIERLKTEMAEVFEEQKGHYDAR